MSFNRKVMFSSHSPEWQTPKCVMEELEEEFAGFDLDPCPIDHTVDGLTIPWEGKVYVNPPYGREIGRWIKKGYESAKAGALVVMLIPSRTDTIWWHNYVMKSDEIRFIKGRLCFSGYPTGAPFPSCIVIFAE